ncbi:MAG TPA: hypothetical protein VF178_09245, partial [Gemmatimonadaceae bacterium]
LQLLTPLNDAQRTGAEAMVEAFCELLAAAAGRARVASGRAVARCLTAVGVRAGASISALLLLRDAAAHVLRDALPDGRAEDERIAAYERAATPAITTTVACLTRQRSRTAAGRRASTPSPTVPMTPAPTTDKDSLIALLTAPLGADTAPRLAEHLLATVRRARANVLVIDVTGLPTLDATTTQWITLTAEAARWLGAAVVVSGGPAALAPCVMTADPTRWHVTADLRGSIPLPNA